MGKPSMAPSATALSLEIQRLGTADRSSLPPLPDPFDGAGLDASQTIASPHVMAEVATRAGAYWTAQRRAPVRMTRSPAHPGIPCEVRCGQNSCSQGVDCTAASACRIDCAGDNSCANAPVDCSGLACKVDCAGDNSCSAGVTCDAGACTLGCLGDSTCDNGPGHVQREDVHHPLRRERR